MTKILIESGFNLTRETLKERKYIKRFGYKSIVQTKAHERTQEQKRKREEWCEKYKNFDWNNVIFTDEIIFRWGKEKEGDGLRQRT